jgi:hypothetical protein
VVTPTDRQAKPDTADKIQRTPRGIPQFFIQPATPRPPAEPDPASRPPAKHARAISDFFIQPTAPRPPAEPDPAPRPLAKPTDRQAKPDAADKIQRTPRDIRQFFMQPATPRPPAEPDPASRPLVKQAAPGPPAEPVPAPRPPAKQVRAISDFFIQPAAPRPPAEPDPAPRPLAKQAAPAKRKAKLRPATVALCQTANAEADAHLRNTLRPAVIALHQASATLDYLDQRLFAMPQADRLLLPSSEQTAWVHLLTPTVRQAKAEAENHLHRSQRDIREFLTRPAPARPSVPVVHPEGLPIPRLRDG